jgi:hypothetical protein
MIKTHPTQNRMAERASSTGGHLGRGRNRSLTIALAGGLDCFLHRVRHLARTDAGTDRSESQRLTRPRIDSTAKPSRIGPAKRSAAWISLPT